MSSFTAEETSDEPIVVIDDASLPGNTSGEQYDSFSGAGTLEILDVVNLLENSGIDCCVAGVGALKYYGAWRVRHGWEVCVPQHKLQTALHILTSPPHDQVYAQCPPGPVQIFSIAHTFPHLRVKGFMTRFSLVPSDDCHFDCVPANFEHSKMGLPYPKLNVFAQSLLDTLNGVALTDLVDGMDLDDKWASNNLDLSGTQDVAWVKRKNEKMRSSALNNQVLELNTEPRHVKPFWEEIVRTKGQRIGPEYPPGVLTTRFRFAGSGDPRLAERNTV